MILWSLLGVITLMAVLNLALVQANVEVVAEVESLTRNRQLYGVPASCLSAVLALVVGGLWTWYSVDVGDWRFAALFWIPFVINRIGAMARRPAKMKQSRRST